MSERRASLTEDPADIERRAKAWLASGNPEDLWPSADVARLPAAAGAIERAMRVLLAGHSTSLGAPNGADANEISLAALPAGVGPLLGWHVEKGMLDVSAQLAALLARHLEHGRKRADRIVNQGLPALAALREGGVDPCVIKGFHSAHVYFPEAGVRPFADIDVIIKASDIQRADRILSSLGFVGDAMIDVPYKRSWSAPGEDGRTWSLEFWHEMSHWKIEIHDRINFEDLFRYGVSLDVPEFLNGLWSLNGVPIRVPGQPLLFAILATHLSVELYERRMIRLVELVLMIRRDIELRALDWKEAEDLLDRLRAKRFAYPALALVEQLAPGTVDDGLLSRSRRAATRLTRYVVDRITPATPLLADRVSLAQRMMWVSGIGETIRRVGLMVGPVRSVPFPVTVQFYRRRVRRLLGGRVSLNMPGAPPDDHASE
jgi:hypothetical protein